MSKKGLVQINMAVPEINAVPTYLPTQSQKYTDPFSGYLGVKESSMADPVELDSLPAPGHQTLVIVEASANSSDSFIERATRFIGSLNTPETIKCNVVTITDGKIYDGLVFTGNQSGGKEVSPTGWNLVIRVSDND